MPSIFEDLMNNNFKQSSIKEESVQISSAKSVSPKKYSVSKFKIESKRIFENTEDFTELDQEFANDPEETTEDEVVLVIDPEIPSNEEVPEDAAEQAVGDLVYKCPVCGSNYLCDCDKDQLEGLEVDDNGVPMECPICGDDAEQILIGEIAPVEGAGEPTELEPKDTDDIEEVETDTEVSKDETDDTQEESLKNKRGGLREATDMDDSEYDSPLTLAQMSFESGHHFDENDFESDEDYEEYVGYIEMGPEGFYEEFKDELDFDPSFIAEYGSDSLDENTVKKSNGKRTNRCPVCHKDPCVCSDYEFDDEQFESLMNKELSASFKIAPRMKVESVRMSKNRLIIEYKLRKGRTIRKGSLVCETFNPKKHIQKAYFKDKGVLTESTKKSVILESKIVIRNNKVTVL